MFLQLRRSVASRHLREVANGVRTNRRLCILRCGEVVRRSAHTCSVRAVSGGILRDCVVVIAAKCYDRHPHEVASGILTDQAVMHTALRRSFRVKVVTCFYFERLAIGGVPRAVASGSAGERAVESAHLHMSFKAGREGTIGEQCERSTGERAERSFRAVYLVVVSV